VAQEMIKKRVRARAVQEGNFYVVHFPDHPTLMTQATHIREIEVMAMDLINLRLEIPLDEIELEVEYISPVAITL
jgi:predicted RNase H-like HicB family nuclease